MNLPLSNRLQACCKFIRQGDRVADVGCDHGYLGIYLLRSGIAYFVIASDVNPLPLQSAKMNAEKFGVWDKMAFYLSDGVQNIPHDFDTLVCAGMGADTMISILSAAPWLRSNQYRLVLQCQSKTPSLRRYLSENGWQILQESIVKDGRFLYTVMEVHYRPGYTLTPGQWYFPPALLAHPSTELPEYYKRTMNGLKKHITGHGEQCDAALVTAFRELENEPLLQRLKEDNHGNSI